MANCIRLSAEDYERLQAKARASKASNPGSAQKRPSGASVPKPVRPSAEDAPRAPAPEFRALTAFQPCPPAAPSVRDAKSGGMNATERRYLSEILHGRARYEPVSLTLLGGSRYTPDFMTREDGVTVFHEVKGGYHLQSHNRAQTAFREAASQYPWCRFVWAELRKGGKWDIKSICEGENT